MNALPIEFGPDGLVPAVIVDGATGDVLMVGFQNREAFERTRETGQVHFWSRSRGKLWRKGETSGHTQSVQEIRVNCENNSLLIEVAQAGAVCHEGYATCYFRRLEPDNSLTIVRDRVFDPADVYGSNDGQPSLAELTRIQLAAYRFLQAHPPVAESRTSALLHDTDDSVTPRIADELDELAGVLDGTHVHQDQRSDTALEAGQVIYWLVLRAVREGLSWDDIRPDRALDAPGGEAPPRRTLARLLGADAAGWRDALTPNRSSPDLPRPGRGASPNAGSGENTVHPARIHATLTLVGQTLASFGLDPKDLIGQDLADLRAKPYLAPFFAAEPAPRQS